MRKPRRRRGRHHIQCLTTQRCNAVCSHCDKAVGLVNLPDIEMTQERMGELVDEALIDGICITRFTFSGGEPIVNRELQGILCEAARLDTVNEFRVLTNDLHSTKEKRDAIMLPDSRFNWCPAPLDNLNDPLSGKNEKGVRYKNRVHLPYWVSPADIGIESSFKHCGIRVFCGKGLDNVGWSMCGQAPILGRILGIDPYPQEGTIVDRILKPVEEICKHCIYGMPMTKMAEEKLRTHLVLMSPTYERELASKPQVFQLAHKGNTHEVVEV